MAQWAVTERSATVKLACKAFCISQACYRYKAKQDAENRLIADWLVWLTNSRRNWGFGLCFLYLGGAGNDSNPASIEQPSGIRSY